MSLLFCIETLPKYHESQDDEEDEEEERPAEIHRRQKSLDRARKWGQIDCSGGFQTL